MTEMAISHFETALRIASPFSWHDQLFRNHYALAELFSKEGRFNNTHDYIEHAKSCAINYNDTYSCQGHSTLMLPMHYSMPSQGQLVQLEVITW